MTDFATLLMSVAGGHTALLLAAFVGLTRYSERTDLYSKSIQESEELLTRMRRRLTVSLEERLDTFFGQADVALDPTVTVHSQEPAQQGTLSYRENLANPVGTDRFREVLADFIEEETGLTMDYQEMARAHRRWCTFARLRRWNVVAFCLWELLCVGAFGLLGKIIGVTFPEWLLRWSFAPTVGLVALFGVCLVFLMIQQDVIDGKRSAYPGF